MSAIVGLKELRRNVDKYVAEIKKGRSFIVLKRSAPIFRISPPDEDERLWETVVDFTKIRKGGIPLEEVLNRL